MKAMIFAAGLGTRLRPLTDKIPKALVTVQGKTMLERVLEKLKTSGFGEVLINVHHHAGQIKKFLFENKNFGLKIDISDESDWLLDTGGGLKKATWFFDDGKPFLVHNIDILSEIDLRKFYQAHLQNKSLATLAVQEKKTDRLLLFDKNWNLAGWKNAKTGIIKMPVNKKIVYEMGFCGIHVINPELLKHINRVGVFSIIDVYLDIIIDKTIRGYQVNEDFWIDIGNLQNLEEAQKYYKG